MKRIIHLWADRPLRVKGIVVVAMPIGALLLSGLLLFSAQQRTAEEQAAVEEVFAERNQIRTVLTLLLDAETGVHSYVLGGQERFLEPYEQAFSELPPTLADMEELLGEDSKQSESHDAAQVARARRVRFLTGQKLEVLGELLVSEGGLNARQQTLLVESNSVMNEVRAEIDTMIEAEEHELETQLAQLDDAKNTERFAFYAALLVGLLGGLLAAFLQATGITRRVRKLEENSVRLVAEEPLVPLSPSRDEIGRLAQSLETAGRLLLERTRSLRDAKEDAEQADRAKTEFLSRTSHELRTPLNSILGFAQLMRSSDLSANDRESVERILKAGRHLLALINDLLDIARIESGGMAIALETTDPVDALGEAWALVRPMADERGISLDDRLTRPAERVVVDRQRLSQVLLNLLSNAIKFNRPDGVVTVSDTLTADRLRISVTDAGPGLDREQVARLFTPFERLGAEHTDVEGTGIGLVVSKRLVEAMGGDIGCDSKVGEGSTFWVELPLASRVRNGGFAAAGRASADI